MGESKKFKKKSILTWGIPLTLIVVLLLIRVPQLTISSGQADAYPQNFSASAILAKKIMEEVAIGGTSAPVASRLYAYPLLASYLPFQDTSLPKNINLQATSLLAGAYVFKEIHPNPFVKNTALSLIRKGELMLTKEESKESLKWAKDYADRVLNIARNDGYDQSAKTYNPPLTIGKYDWRPTGFDKQAPLESGWGGLKTLNQASEDCTLELPSSMGVFDEQALALGKQDDTLGNTANVIWWLAGFGTPTPSGQWLNIAMLAAKDHNLKPEETSRLLASMAVSNFDTSIKTWYYKYKFKVVRPQNLYITLTGQYYNLYRDTPNHPSYPGGHSAFSASAGTILINTIGDVPIRDALGEDVLVPKEVRNFNSVTEAIKAASQSRIDAKFHYPIDTTAGEQLGSCIAKNIDINKLIKEQKLV